ncbi:MAG: 50S ribosomal protein L6 [Candidatus Colwellbacteria bacterium]
MSKIGKRPIDIPEGVTVEVKEDEVTVKGPKATLTVSALPNIDVKVDGSQVIFTPQNDTKQTISNWGTFRALVQNAIIGATDGYSKTLVIEGVGYRASVEGSAVVLNLGFSHPIKYDIPEGITVEVEGNKVKISGFDKAVVGETAASIRAFRKPEPYKGKGIKYEDEVVRRKAGKKAVSSGG